MPTNAPASHTGSGPMPHSSVDLYWIPLGAGHHSVRNGIVYEAAQATLQRQPGCDLYHSALHIRVSNTSYWVEMTPVPDRHSRQRGVVAEGAVGLRSLGRVRLFRYEIRRWRDGLVPDLAYAVESPVRVTTDPDEAAAVFHARPPRAHARVGARRVTHRRHVELQLRHLLDARHRRPRRRRAVAARPRAAPGCDAVHVVARRAVAAPAH